jgi:uncharacterized protein YcfJ
MQQDSQLTMRDLNQVAAFNQSNREVSGCSARDAGQKTEISSAFIQSALATLGLSIRLVTRRLAMKLTSILAVGILALSAGFAQADHANKKGNYGRVIHVEPVYRTYTTSRKHDSCIERDYRVPVQTSYNSTILGAVIGSALGHSIGDAHGDPGAAAIAGGLIGASFGQNVDRRNSYNRQLHVKGPCRSDRRHKTVRELVEYKVTYRYNGKTHKARMDHDPGKWVKLNVNVSPA